MCLSSEWECEILELNSWKKKKRADPLYSGLTERGKRRGGSGANFFSHLVLISMVRQP